MSKDTNQSTLPASTTKKRDYNSDLNIPPKKRTKVVNLFSAPVRRVAPLRSSKLINQPPKLTFGNQHAEKLFPTTSNVPNTELLHQRSQDPVKRQVEIAKEFIKKRFDASKIIKELDRIQCKEKVNHFFINKLLPQGPELVVAASNDYYEEVKNGGINIHRAAAPNYYLSQEEITNFTVHQNSNSISKTSKEFSNRALLFTLVDENITFFPSQMAIAGKKQKKINRHSAITYGAPVSCAGTSKANAEGKISFLSNESGHYRPTFLEILTTLEKSPNLFTKDCTIGLWRNLDRGDDDNLDLFSKSDFIKQFAPYSQEIMDYKKEAEVAMWRELEITPREVMKSCSDEDKQTLINQYNTLKHCNEPICAGPHSLDAARWNTGWHKVLTQETELDLPSIKDIAAEKLLNMLKPNQIKHSSPLLGL